MREKGIMNRSDVFQALRNKGAWKAIVDFSGGGDEGGADHICLVNEEEIEFGSIDPWGDDGNRELAETLTEPIYDRWGSFAGEFYVHGQLIWDAQANTVKFAGEESEQVYKPFEEEI
jgi:hypothetical protein